MNHEKAIRRQRIRRERRVRAVGRGTAQRPRLTVFRSHQHVYCQLIDDEIGRTLASASTRDKQLRSGVQRGSNKDAAVAVGKAIAERATAVGVNQIYFDRGPYKYHGRVAALANAAREAGLGF